MWFYPQYDEATCYEQALGDFDEYDTEKYATKTICCMEKFGNDVIACCEGGDGECATDGSAVYIPNWSKQKCDERNSALTLSWESDYVSDTVEECCKKCKHPAATH